MELYCYCFMPNHVHLIYRSVNEKPSELLRDFKRYTSQKIIETIKNNPQESRKEMNKAKELFDIINSKFDFLNHFVNKGATEKEIADLETEIGFDLPINYKNLLKIINGEGDNKLGILGLFLSNTKYVISQLKFFKDSPIVEPEELYQEKLVKPNFYNSKRIPFASDESGLFLCIDFDPDENGVYGQIIYLPCAEPEPVSVIAKSFDDFLDFIIDAYKTEKIYLCDGRDDWDEDDWEEWRVNENSDYSRVELFFRYKWKQDWTDIADIYNIKIQKLVLPGSRIKINKKNKID